MLFMKKSGFQTYDFKSNNLKKFIITFDDGYEDVFINALPILLNTILKPYVFLLVILLVKIINGTSIIKVIIN